MKADYRIKHLSELSPYMRDVALKFYRRQEELAASQERYEDAAKWRDAADMGLIVVQTDSADRDWWEGFTAGMPYGPLDGLSRGGPI